MPNSSPIRVAIYGCGRFANQTHIPNLRTLSDVEIVALCDSDPASLQQTGDTFGIEGRYTDAHEMLASEAIDALYSIVPAYVRSDVEIAAVERGIHLFSEKPQALEIGLARRIDDAIRRREGINTLIHTVGFRERYRPIFQQARQFLADKQVSHVRFLSVGGLPAERSDWRASWWNNLEKSGGPALDWGVHATDYVRFMTGLNIKQSQAYYHRSDAYSLPLAYSFHYCLSNGAAMTMSFLNTTSVRPANEPWFTLFYEGGYLAIHGYERIEVNGETFYSATPFDPWLEQTRSFIQAVRTLDLGLLLSDYHDGLYSLAPVLAGWESAKQGGKGIDVEEFLRNP